MAALAYCVIGSTADSGSVSEGSTPSRPAFWSLRLSARMEDSQSSERGSIPLGTKGNSHFEFYDCLWLQRYIKGEIPHYLFWLQYGL